MENNDPDCLITERLQLIEWRRQSPFSIAHMQRVGHNLPRDAEDERQRVIGDFVDAVVGDVADGDAALLCRLHVDVVVADAVANDDFGSPHRVDWSELCDDRVGVGDQRLPRRDLLVVRAPQLKPGGGQDRL
jgi:hypothetical protein